MSLFDSYNLTNALYEAHKNGGFYADLFQTTLVPWILSLPGLIFNPALVYVTYKERSLHGSCNILLAIGALFDFIYLSGYSVPFFLTLSGINFIPLMACFWIQLIPLSALFASVNSVFFVGFDRLLNVLVPYHYHQINQCIYLCIDLCIIAAYSAYVIVAYGVPGVWTYPNWAVTCGQSDMYSFVRNNDLSRNGVVINCASFICYLVVWFFIWKFKTNTSMHGGGGNDEIRNRRIFKSVLLIMLLVVGCWLFNVVNTTMIAPLLVDWPVSVNFIQPAVKLLTVIVASTSNPPILYICSKEYRRAFQRLILKCPLLKCCFKKIFKDVNSTSIAVKTVQPGPMYLTGPSR